MEMTYWLFAILIVGFLVIGSHLDRVISSLEEIRQELRTIRRELTKDKERIDHLGYPGYYDPPVTATSPEPLPPQPNAFIRAMRWSGNHVGRLLRRAS